MFVWWEFLLKWKKNSYREHYFCWTQVQSSHFLPLPLLKGRAQESQSRHLISAIFDLLVPLTFARIKDFVCRKMLNNSVFGHTPVSLSKEDQQHLFCFFCFFLGGGGQMSFLATKNTLHLWTFVSSKHSILRSVVPLPIQNLAWFCPPTVNNVSVNAPIRLLICHKCHSLIFSWTGHHLQCLEV